MTTRLTIGKGGRVVIPKSLREAMHLEAGDTLELESTGDQIMLRPVRETNPLTQEKGVWVLRCGQSLSASANDGVLEQIRIERDSGNQV